MGVPPTGSASPTSTTPASTTSGVTISGTTASGTDSVVLVQEADVFAVTAPTASSGTYSLLISIEVSESVAAEVADRGHSRTGRNRPAAPERGHHLVGPVRSRCDRIRDGHRLDNHHRGGAVTLLSVFSVKGAPGVTTLSCLLAAAWSGPGPVVVAESDPAGGDLAARFGLSSRVGWVSLTSSTRRSEGTPPLVDHLQQLPGGLPVLVGARGGDRRPADSEEGTVVRTYSDPAGGSGRFRGLTVVDLGRYTEGDTVSGSWLLKSDISVLVVPGDASVAVNLRDRAPQLLETCEGRLELVVVGGTYGCSDMAAFTGIVGIADLPIESSAAAACRTPGSGRRLELSLLWAAVGKLADSLTHRLETGWPEIGAPDGPTDAPADPIATNAPPPRRSHSKGSVRRARSRKQRKLDRSPDTDRTTDAEIDPVDAGEALKAVGA